MTKRIGLFQFLTLAIILLCTSCYNADKDEATPKMTAVFNLQSEVPVLPVPNEVIPTALGERLPAEVGDNELDAEIKSQLNKFNGFPNSSATTIYFDREPDPKMLNEEYFQLYDITEALKKPDNPPIKLLSESILLSDGDAESTGTADYRISSKSRKEQSGDSILYAVDLIPTTIWASGHDYLVIISPKLQSQDGLPCFGSAEFSLLRSGTPLVSDGKIQSALLVDDYAEDRGLSTAQQLEDLRLLHQPFFEFAQKLGFDKKEIPVLFSYHIDDDAKVLFDPADAENRVSFPTIGAYDTEGMKVALPTEGLDPGSLELVEALNAYNGFGSLMDLFNPVEGHIVEESINKQTVKVYIADINENGDFKEIRAFEDFELNYKGDEKLGRIEVIPTQPFPENSIVAVCISKGVKGNAVSAGDSSVIGEIKASAAYYAASSAQSLIDDAGKSRLGLLNDEEAGMLEPLRVFNDRVIKAVLDFESQQAKNKSGYEASFKTRSDFRGIQIVPTHLATQELFIIQKAFADGSLSSGYAFTATPVDSQALKDSLKPTPINTIHWPDESEAYIISGSFDALELRDPMLVTDYMELLGPSLDDLTLHDWRQIRLDKSGRPVDMKGDPMHQIVQREFILTLPKVHSNSYPVVILQHDLDSRKEDMLMLARAFTNNGWATIAIDASNHGSRKESFMGTELPIIMPLLHHTRDNIRQSILDLVQLVGFINSLKAAEIDDGQGGTITFSLDPQQIAFLGESLGGMIGSVFLAIEPRVKTGVLTATGGHYLKVLLETQDLSDVRCPMIEAFAMALETDLSEETCPYDNFASSASFIQFEQFARMVLGPAEPLLYADRILSYPERSVLLQKMDKDLVIPNATTDMLYKAITPPYSLNDVTFNGGEHGFLTDWKDEQLTRKAQKQAVDFITSGGQLTPVSKL